MAEQYLTKAGLAYFYSKLDLKAGSVDIRYGTTAEWNSQADLISELNVIYVYTDYQTVNGQNMPGIKFGDGLAYLIDLPIIGGNTAMLTNHVNDNSVHLVNGERSFWNDKVSCFLSPTDSEELIFTTNVS